MEGDVGLDVAAAGGFGRGGLHGGQCVVQGSYVLGAGPAGGEPGRLGLDDPAQFARVAQQCRGVPGLLPAQDVAVQVVPELGGQDARAGAGAHLQHPLGHQSLDRFPQRAPADADLGREQVLDRQRMPRFPHAAHDAAAELVDHALMHGRETHHDLRSPLDVIHRII
ncbi:conserved hypothetical protein [Actinacidiphila bryophytorum]|uniref:Uncharacterized protein n=1 Tax=Actinacidiphila bryophytorum TaxID=1436133 RepID=A0A9W4MH22_9ACTN|nr:conserved hypothetical protein [Actinacidiphila bryophytorum]